MTTSTLLPEAVELEASYEISLRSGSYRIVSGYRLAELLEAHRLSAGLLIVRIGDVNE